MSFVLALFAPPTHSRHSVSFADRFDRNVFTSSNAFVSYQSSIKYSCCSGKQRRRLGCRDGRIVGSRQSEDLFATMLFFLLFFSSFPASLPLISRVYVSVVS